MTLQEEKKYVEGRIAGLEQAITMKNINNTKVTLTLSQLKQFVKESTATDPISSIETDLLNIQEQINQWNADGAIEYYQYSYLFDLADDALAKLDELKDSNVAKDAQ